jgi:hypothetical protein
MLITVSVLIGLWFAPACNMIDPPAPDDDTNHDEQTLDPDPNPGFHFDEQTFYSEWKAWEDQNIKNYSFVLSGELPYWNYTRAIPLYEYKVKVIVKNGVMDSFEYIGKTPYTEDSEAILEPECLTLSDLFRKIENQANSEKDWWAAYYGDGALISTKLYVTYDTRLHHVAFYKPVSKWKPEWIIDSTASAITVSNFTILDGSN